MIILGIETSCDETALALIEAKAGADDTTEIKILANHVLSQIELHRQYGGVFPMMAKREHSRNLIPLLKTTIEQSGFGESRITPARTEAARSGRNHESRLGLQNRSDVLENIRTVLEREPELLKQFLEFIPTIEKPPIDLIAVTHGPGLEPCLWTGLNLAKALSAVWEIPLVPVNHMEGHILVSLLQRNKKFSIFPAPPDPAERDNFQFSKKKTTDYKLQTILFPALALLISGGHTELVLMKSSGSYEIVGRTRDDAVGEAFDKVARILGLPYPGGPQISALAEIARLGNSSFLPPKDGSASGGKGGAASAPRPSEALGEGGRRSPPRRINPSSEDGVLPLGKGELNRIILPRPMMKSDNLDFSFSGLKTAVLYLVKKISASSSIPPFLKEVAESARTEDLNPPAHQNDPPPLRKGELPTLTDNIKMEIAREFEDAATEVLTAKTKKAIELYGVKTLLLGGGVVANTHIRGAFETVAKEQNIPLHLPAPALATDNALMITLAGYFNRKKALRDKTGLCDLKADGNLHF